MSQQATFVCKSIPLRQQILVIHVKYIHTFTNCYFNPNFVLFVHFSIITIALVCYILTTNSKYHFVNVDILHVFTFSDKFIQSWEE
jgi:hypothetical protein